MPLSWLLRFAWQSSVFLGLILYPSNLHLHLLVAFFLCVFTWLPPCASHCPGLRPKGIQDDLTGTKDNHSAPNSQ